MNFIFHYNEEIYSTSKFELVSLVYDVKHFYFHLVFHYDGTNYEYYLTEVSVYKNDINIYFERINDFIQASNIVFRHKLPVMDWASCFKDVDFSKIYTSIKECVKEVHADDAANND